MAALIIIAENCLGAFAAITVIAYSVLGDVIVDKHSLNLFSGALIAIGSSMMTAQGTGVSILTSRIIHGFGFGVIFSTLPAYVSQPGFSFLNSVLRSSLCVLLGAMAICYISNTSLEKLLPLPLQGYYLALIIVAAILLWMFQGSRVDKFSQISGRRASANLHPSMGRLNQGQLPFIGGDKPKTERGHPFDYYSRPGDILRPPPSRTLHSPEWFPMRKRLLSRYIDVQPIPKRTAMVERMQDRFWQGDEYMDPVVA